MALKVKSMKVGTETARNDRRTIREKEWLKTKKKRQRKLTFASNVEFVVLESSLFNSPCLREAIRKQLMTSHIGDDGESDIGKSSHSNIIRHIELHLIMRNSQRIIAPRSASTGQ